MFALLRTVWNRWNLVPRAMILYLETFILGLVGEVLPRSGACYKPWSGQIWKVVTTCNPMFRWRNLITMVLMTSSLVGNDQDTSGSVEFWLWTPPDATMGLLVSIPYHVSVEMTSTGTSCLFITLGPKLPLLQLLHSEKSNHDPCFFYDKIHH